MSQATIIIYSKAHCPYCDHAKQLLEAKGLTYTEHRVDLEPQHLDDMLARGKGRTFPQIIIGETAIGGFDDLAQLVKDGQLDALLEK